MARGDSHRIEGPGSLLPEEPQRRHARRSEQPLPQQGPSSLLPEEAERRAGRYEAPLQHGPSSLLPQSADTPPSAAPNPDVVPVSPSSLLPPETGGHPARRTEEPLPAHGPSSLLPTASHWQPKPVGPEVVAVSPTSLLPADAGAKAYRAEELLPQRGPSSLLPEAAAQPATPAEPEVVAVSPSELLPLPDPVERRWDRRRAAAIIAAVIVPVLLGVALLLGLERSPAPTELAARGSGQDKAQGADLIAALSAQIASQPDNAELRHRLGSAYALDGDYKQAELEFRRALELGADRRQAVTALARALLLQGEFDRLLSEAEKFPDNAKHVVPDLDTARAFAYLGLGKEQEAEALFVAVLELDPRNGDALLGKARLAASRNQPKEAQRLEELVSKYADQSRDAQLDRAQLIWVLDKAAELRASGQG